jgi:hypothetical protein
MNPLPEPAPARLSVVVVIVSDTTDGHCDLAHLAGCLEALAAQSGAQAAEVIVPYHPAMADVSALRRRFPGVTFLACDDLKTFTGRGGSREHHDELRARGLDVARGEVVGLLEDHARPDAGWAAAMIEAHQGPCAGVGGAIENGIDRALNWAVYFCDFGKYQNPVPAGESAFASDANVSYKRSALAPIRPVWQKSFHEPAVNGALRSRGERLALAPRAVVYQHRSDLRLAPAVKERFIWGRSFAAARGKGLGARRLVYAAASPVLPAVLLLRMTATALKRRRRLGAFVRALPLTLLLTAGWAAGELVGYLTGAAGGEAAPHEGLGHDRPRPATPEPHHADRR